MSASRSPRLSGTCNRAQRCATAVSIEIVREENSGNTCCSSHARSIAPNADIVLLHAFDVPFEGQLRYASVDNDTINHYRIVAKQEATQKLHALRDEAGLNPYGTSLVVLHGDPTLRIIEQEQEWDCDLIVMGKHGENLLEALLIGSVTKQVLAESMGDVLVSV